MAKNKLKINLDIEPIVKLVCSANKCKYNLATILKPDDLYCNLKHVHIDEKGRCFYFELIDGT